MCNALIVLRVLPGLHLTGGGNHDQMDETRLNCGVQEAEPVHYPAQVFAPLLTAFQAGKVAAVYYQAIQAADGSTADVAAHIRRAVDGVPQRQPPALGHAIVRSASPPLAACPSMP